MIIELVVAGLIANAGYLVANAGARPTKKPARVKVKRAVPARRKLERKVEARHRVSVIGVLRDVKTALSAADSDNLHLAMNPELKHAVEQRRLQEKRDFYLSLGALAVAGLSALYPALIGLGAAAIVYLNRAQMKLIWRDFKRGHYLSVYLVSFVLTLLMIAGGYIFLAALNSVVFGFFASLINRLEANAEDKLAGVFNQHPERVWVLKGDVEVQVPFNAVKVGDLVKINAGEVVAVDGRVVDGMGQVDQHVLTGESQPVEKEAGDEVFASTLLLSGRLTVEVTVSGENTVAAKIGQVLNQTKSHKDALMVRGRAIGDGAVPVRLGLASVAFALAGWNAALAVMWANLGQGISITAPLTLMSYLQVLSRRQILVKDGRVFESLQRVDTMVFDKTGTLTEEQPTLGRVHAFNGFDEAELLRLAAAAEHRQPHPIARAIVAKAEAEGIDYPVLEEASYEVGYGLKVKIDGRVVRVGSERFVRREGIRLPQAAEEVIRRAEALSHSLVHVGVGDHLAGVLELEPTIRPEAEGIVSLLKDRGIEVCIISGDHEAPTRNLAERLGIERYFAETLPENKAKLVRELRDQGRFVCFVGDGVNDAIALKTAQVSISLKGASTVATDTAQIIFMDGTLKRLGQLFEAVDEFKATMQRALALSFGPGSLTVAGIFFLHFGVAVSLMILYFSMCLGISNILWPIVKHQDRTPEPKLIEPTPDDDKDGAAV